MRAGKILQGHAHFQPYHRTCSFIVVYIVCIEGYIGGGGGRNPGFSMKP